MRASFLQMLLLGLGVLFIAFPSAAETRIMPLRVPASGKPGFTRLPGAQTGILFTNFLSEARGLTNTIVNNGAGLAAGDVDGDGLCDLYFCSLEGGNKLFRNLGNWRFEDITASAGVACTNQFSTGAVLADVDGDGHLDLLVNSIGGGTRLFINDGKAHFTEKTDSGLVRRFGSTSMALADIDGNGTLDLYVANYRTTSIMDEPGVRFTLSKINGQPVVTKVNGVPTSSPELEGRFIISPTGGVREAGEPDVLYLNDGHGHFTPVSWTGGAFLDENGQPLNGPPRDWGLSVMFHDLNGDGAPDLYVCNDADSPDRIWINVSGTGVSPVSLEPHGRDAGATNVLFRALPKLAIRHTSLSSMGVDVGDLNRDGHADLLVLDMLARRHEKRHTFLEKSRPPFLAPGNLDARPQYSRNTFQLGRGDGSFAEIAEFAGLQASDWAWCPIFLDVDLDGFEDLLVVNGFHRQVEDIDVADKMRATKASRKISPQEELQMRAMFERWETPNLAFRNRGDLTFAEVGKEWGFDWEGVSQGIVLADLDNDGDLDVIVNNLNGPVCIYRNDSTAPRVCVRLKGTPPNTEGIGATLRLIGGAVPVQTQEILAGGRYLSSDEAVRTFAAGSPTKRLTLEVQWRSGKFSVVTNIPANSLCVVEEAGAGAGKGGPGFASPAAPAVASTAPFFSDVSELLNHTHVEAGFDDFERQPLLSRRLSQLGPGLAWCDVDGDGWDDLVIASGRGGSLSVLRNTGQGSFQAVTLPAFKAVAADDLTGIVGWSAEAGQSALLVGQANYESAKLDSPAVMEHDLFFGNLESAAAVPGDASSVGPLAVADMEGNGNLELFVGGRVVGGKYPMPASSRLYRRVGSKWELDEAGSASLKAVGLVSSAVWTDLDGDGKPELALACEWGSPRIFRNQNGHLSPWDAPLTWAEGNSSPTSRPSRISQLTGWWNSVTAGDFDGDGRLDLVLGNWGLNNKYREFVSGGLRVYHGDIDGNGAWDLIEGYFEPRMKKVVPWRDWKVMQAAVPMLSERFKTYREYAEASVQEIVGAEFKQLAELRADVLESVVLLNRGDHFEVRELPLEAQLAPAFGLCVGDYDADGKEDVFVAQNFFGTDPDTGRYDAGRGLWLRGNGRGGFLAVPGQESGVKVYGEQRGAALCDFDGDARVDLVVSQNGAQTKLYRNTGGKPGLRVRLTGAGSNGSGFGAVARLGRDGQWGAAREVHGGSGYWSQDSAVQVMSLSGGAAAQIQVRWPGGKVTTNDVPANAREIRVSTDGKIDKVK